MYGWESYKDSMPKRVAAQMDLYGLKGDRYGGTAIGLADQFDGSVVISNTVLDDG